MTCKILIIRLSAIGDVVHTLPALHALRRARPHARIDWLVEELSSSLLVDHPELDHLHIFRKKWRKRFTRHLFPDVVPFFKSLRAVRYDWAIDFQGLTKSGLAAYFSRARRVVGFGDKDGRELNKLFTNVKVRPENVSHIVEKNLALLKPLGISEPAPEFVFPDTTGVLEHSLLPDSPFAIINPGAGWITKRLPLDTLANLGVELNKQKNLKLLITWGPGEKDMAQDLAGRIQTKGATAFLAPPTDLRQLCRLISRATLFIGGDTGPTHIAAAMGIPVVSFFGSSDARRNHPYGKRTVTIQKTKIPCVPCWKTRCPIKGERHLACLKTITSDELLQASLRLLEEEV